VAMASTCGGRLRNASPRPAASSTGNANYLLAFSCKGRYFCPSCHAKRLAIWAQWLDTALLAPVPHRQVVLTIPKRLRAYCLYRRRLLGEIARVAARTVTAAIRTLTGEQDLAVGIVACLQTHGSRAEGPLASAPASARHGWRVPARRDVRVLARARHRTLDRGVPPRCAPAVRAPGPLR
jgi:hypothetical protein